MKGQLETLNVFLLLLLVVGLSVVIYTVAMDVFGGLLSPLMFSPQKYTVPPKIEGSIVEFNGSSYVVCMFLHNVSSEEISLSDVKVLLEPGGYTGVFSEECNVVPPGDVCEVCFEVNQEFERARLLLPGLPPQDVFSSARPDLPPYASITPELLFTSPSSFPYAVEFELKASDDGGVLQNVSFDCEGDSTYEFVWEDVSSPFEVNVTCSYSSYGTYRPVLVVEDKNGNRGSAQASVYLYYVTVSHGLTFSPPDENRYSNVLFFGEHNTVKVIIDSGPEGTYAISSPCLSNTSHYCDTFPCSFETNTLTTSPSCEINVEDPLGNIHTYSFPIWYYIDCDSCDSCSNAFTEANSYLTSNDTNALVLLTQDLSSSLTCVSVSSISPPPGRTIIFDGNNHMVETTANYAHATYLKGSSNINISNINTITAGYRAYVLYSYDSSHVNLSNVTATTSGSSAHALSLNNSSDINLSDTNLYSQYASDLHFSGDSYLSSATNSYCHGKPILVINSQQNQSYDLNAAEYCHVSVANSSDLNLNFYDEANTHSIFLYIYDSNDIEVNGLNATTYGHAAHALSLNNSSDINLSDTNLYSHYDMVVYLTGATSNVVFDLSEKNIGLSMITLSIYLITLGSIYFYRKPILYSTSRSTIYLTGCNGYLNFDHLNGYFHHNTTFGGAVSLSYLDKNCLGETNVSPEKLTGVVFISNAIKAYSTKEWNLALSSDTNTDLNYFYWSYYIGYTSPKLYGDGNLIDDEASIAVWEPRKEVNDINGTTYPWNTKLRVGLYHFDNATRNLVLYFPDFNIIEINAVNDGTGVLLYNIPKEVNVESGKFFEFNVTLKNPTNEDVNVAWKLGDKIDRPVHVFIDLSLENNQIGYPLCDYTQWPTTVPANTEMNVLVRCYVPFPPGTYYLRFGPAWSILNVR